MSKAKHNPFATDDKDMFIRVSDSGIDLWLIAFDGLSVVYFGDETTPYLRVEDAIAWHEKEHVVNQAAVDALKECLSKFRAGKWQASA